MSISITNPNDRPVVSAQASGLGEDGVGIAIDYTTYYARIATALETIATQATTIAAQTTIIAAQTTIVAAQTTIVASKQTAMETYQKKLKELGEGSGIRVIGPYEVFGMISIYR
jgi:hypothetical protein